VYIICILPYTLAEYPLIFEGVSKRQVAVYGDFSMQFRMGFMGLWAVVAFVLFTTTAFVAPAVTNDAGTRTIATNKALEPGEELTIYLPGNVPLVLVRIPAGTFMMGRYPGELDSSSDEDPRHQITINQNFYMGKYEITQRQWLALMGSWPGTAPSEGGDYPAYYVSWNDAKDFITALNTHIENTAQGFVTVRLPSEAEWEYACRAGTTTRYYFGDSLDCGYQCEDCVAGVLPGNRSDYMWYCGISSPSGSKPVGGKLPNAFGLYDMSGNVSEWCEDDYHSSYTSAPSDGSVWVDSPRGASRVARGGFYNYHAKRCRSAQRGDNELPDNRINNLGFRIAASLVDLTIMLPGDVPLELVKIPAGSFMMGRYSGEQDSEIAEDPQHLVTISQDFYMGKYEVTQQQWLALMGSWPGTAPSSTYGVGNSYPVYYVSWDDTKNFITALNTHITNTGQGPATVRLPSEAEWEYACRSGKTTRFYWGDDLSDTQIGGYAWYIANNSPSGTKPVSQKLPNAFGLYDMSGNVWEWCEDDWHENYTGAPNDGSAWVYSPRGSDRIGRGGYWGGSAQDCRSADRVYSLTNERHFSLGFRLAANVPKPEITINLPGDVPLKLVPIPAGAFMMGRHPGEQDSASDEDPQHSANILQDFYMGKYEVTQQQWLAVMGSWPSTEPSSTYGVGDDYPAYYISWDDTKNFITALNTHITNTSQGPITVRLPSEAEWEYACRAGTTMRYYWGDDSSYTQIGSFAWYSDNSGSTTHIVGGRTFNAFGLYDMSGNVWEWCEDDYHSSYTGAPTNGSAWVDSPRGSGRVDRGGGWGYGGSSGCRSANRDGEIPAFTSYNIGFRLAATVPRPEITIYLPGDVPLVLVNVPAGTFQMGRYAGEQDSVSDEDPQHEVTISQNFWMGKYEVTQQQWLALMGSWPGTAPSSTYGVGDTYPAYYRTWDDTQSFIAALNTHITNSSQGSATFRLPSEAEWEYACRAGTTTRFYFGDSLECTAADCSDCAAGVLAGNRSDYMWYCGNNIPDGFKPVGGKLPNGFGLFDMSGNAYEWCEDDWHADYTGAPIDGSAWLDVPRGTSRVQRGGYWNNNARDCRSADRGSYLPDATSVDFGFRIAADEINIIEGEGEGEPVEGEGEPVEGEGEPVEGEGEPVEGEGEPVEGEGEPVEGEGEPVEGEGEPCNTDTEDPVISQCAASQTVVADVDGNASVPEFSDVVATDNCTLVGALIRTQSPEAGTQVKVGEYEITITIADEAGNSADCTAMLTVTPWPWRFGDATLDGNINTADATEALRLATGGTPALGKEDSLVTADVDQNGAVTRADMLSIFAFVQSGGIVTEVPKNLIAQSGVNEIILLWGPVPHDNVRGYIVERRIEGESAWTRLPETEDPVYYDQEIASARYEYRVAVIDMLGNVETFSDSVTVLGNTLILWAPWAQGLAGDTVVAPIGIGSTRGLNPSDVSITATYDASIVEYQDVLTTVLSKNLQFIVDTSVPGAITIFATAPQGQLPIGEGRFFDLQMKLKEDAPDGCQETLITSAVIGNASGGGINTESQPGAVCVGDVRWGDLDDDGVVTIADAQLVLDIITRNETFTNELLFKCDMNGDRRIDAADAVLILRLARGLSINPEQDKKALNAKAFSSRVVTLPDSVSVPKDCQFLLPVTVDDASELAGMDLVISYTRADLRCDAVCATPATAGYELNTELGTGYVRISLGDATSLPSGETEIAYMIFTAIGEETVEGVRPPARVRINYAELKGELGESFRWYGDITRQNAEVTILAEGACTEVPDCDTLTGEGEIEGEPGTGTLRVYLGPVDAIAAGAQWRRVDTTQWLNSEATEGNLLPGSYQVEFKEINCWMTPLPVPVLIHEGQVFTATGTYTAAECEGEGEPTEGEPVEGEEGESVEGEEVEGEEEGEPLEGEGEPMSLEDIANALLDQFDNADTDGDGRLSYDEAHAVVPEMTEGQFNDLDANPDGKLSQRELRALLCGNHCGCCCNSSNVKGDIKRYIGDWLFVGLSLLVLISLASRQKR
jgi:formylglycine-generating enzyme required for sulfatase activity